MNLLLIDAKWLSPGPKMSQNSSSNTSLEIELTAIVVGTGLVSGDAEELVP